MRALLCLLAIAAATPAWAQESTTLQNVTSRGIVIKAMGMEIPVNYTPDGKWTATPPGAQVGGTWRIDGDRLCTRTGSEPEACAAYPAGKKPGETFPAPGAMGPALGVVQVRING